MVEADLTQFGELLDAVCSLLSRGTYRPNAVNTALWFSALAEYDLDTVRAALHAHVRDPERGRFVPNPADIIAQIRGRAEADGRPGSDEAWALSLTAQDEAETVVWTHEMAMAWAIAQPVLQAGDKVGARMAFREAYDRLTQEARRLGEKAVWSASLGFDVARRTVAITEAVRLGKLSRSELQALPAPPRGEVLLLGHDIATDDSARQKVIDLVDRLRNRPEPVSLGQLERDRTEALKAETERKVVEFRAREKGESA